MHGLYESGENYLETILILKSRGLEVRSIDIVREMNLSKPRVSRAMKILKEGVTSYDVFVHAIKKGLMLRDCSTFLGMEDETFFRFCFMMPDKNTELLACLKELLG